jgi:hypothetical protein
LTGFELRALNQGSSYEFENQSYGYRTSLNYCLNLNDDPKNKIIFVDDDQEKIMKANERKVTEQNPSAPLSRLTILALAT